MKKVWKKFSRGSNFVACGPKAWKELEGEHQVEEGDTFHISQGRSIGNGADQIARMNSASIREGVREAQPLTLKRLPGTSEIWCVVAK